jgi:folate-binding protein YgfZ
VIAGRSASDMVEAGGIVAGARAARAVRVEAGEPKMGEDLDEATIPNETGLVPFAVSFTKGCYLGQELVARIDSRGRVNRHLRGVVITENVLPPDRAAVMVGEAEVGRVTSVVESLTLRAPVGLALVRREVEPGTDVAIAWAGRSIGGTVRALPLDDFSDPSQYSNSPP